MNKIKLLLVGIIIILFILPNLANASLDEHPIERSPWTEKEQPKTIEDAVNEIEQMIKEERPRWEIAKRVATIADNQIKNKNDPERMEVTWKHWFGDLFGESDEDRNFNNWRDKQGGGDASYNKAARWVWESRYGQCGENAALVYYLLKEAGAKDVCIFSQEEPDHAFVVWGMDEEADPNKPESWTNDVIIPDSHKHHAWRGQKAFNNEYVGGKKVEEITHEKDKEVKPRCGYRSTVNYNYPCCKSKKIGPCRGTERLVCLKGICVSCGNKGKPCCEGKKCNFPYLVCTDGKCVRKSEEEEEELAELEIGTPGLHGMGFLDFNDMYVGGIDVGVSYTFLARVQERDIIDVPQTATTYEWDFDDGTAPVRGDEVIHVFARIGAYTITVNLSDDTGDLWATGTTEMTVVPPIDEAEALSEK